MKEIKDYDSILSGLIDVWRGKVGGVVSSLNVVASAVRLIQDMKKVVDSQKAEKEVLNKFRLMCQESLDPETYEKFERVESVLVSTRRKLK